MTDKELLGKIKESRERILNERSFQMKCAFLNSFVELDYLDWLIEQAEKTEKYREALEHIERIQSVDVAQQIARQALEGE